MNLTENQNSLVNDAILFCCGMKVCDVKIFKIIMIQKLCFKNKQNKNVFIKSIIDVFLRFIKLRDFHVLYAPNQSKHF